MRSSSASVSTKPESTLLKNSKSALHRSVSMICSFICGFPFYLAQSAALDVYRAVAGARCQHSRSAERPAIAETPQTSGCAGEVRAAQSFCEPFGAPRFFEPYDAFGAALPDVGVVRPCGACPWLASRSPRRPQKEPLSVKLTHRVA